MLFSFQCPSCQGHLEADASSSGSQAECPQCGQLVAIPASRVGEGSTLAGFRLERRLGKGGMGEVFLARQLSVDRQVAVKILPPGFAENSEAVARFLREGKMAARLDHENIATVYEAGEDNGNYYLAMAYIHGESLGQRLAREGALSEKEALRMVRAVAAALGYAWRAFGLLHRDIKPANIMVDVRNRVFLMDLGLAKRLSEESGMTVSGAVLGTPRYMSPEQALGKSDIGVASDVYSLGATLYHLTTGSPPFVGDSVPRLLHQHVYEPLPPPRERNPKLSDGCVQLLETMLAKESDERYGEWEGLVADIDRVLGGGRHVKGHGVHAGGVRDKVSLARQAQEALARQHQHEFEHAHEQENAEKPESPAWYRRPAVLVSAAATIALLLAVVGVLVSQRGKAPLTEAKVTDGGAQASPPASEPTVAGADAASSPPPKVEETPEPPKAAPVLPEAASAPAPAPVPAPAPAPQPAPVQPVDPGASDLALARIALPHTGDWCLGFDEEGGEVTVPDLKWNSSMPLTVEVVFTPLQSETAPVTAGRSGTAGLWINIQDEKLVAHRRGEGNAVVSAETSFVPGRSLHAAAVWDTAELRLYVNGRLVARGGAPQAAAPPGTEAFVVGGRGAVNWPEGVEAVRVSGTARYTSDFDIDQVLPFKAEPVTLCLLDLEEGEGEVAKDSSGHDCHGHIRGVRWRRMWPYPLAEERLQEVEAALRRANPGVPDLRVRVGSLPNGMALNLQGNHSLQDISPLAGLPILALNLVRTSVGDLSPLEGMRLGALYLDRWPTPGYAPVGEGVEDLSALAGMPLRVLTVSGHQRLQDLTPLQGRTLRILYLWGTGASDLSPLAGAPVEVLLLGSPALSDIGPLQGMPLRVLSLAPCSLITDLKPIAGCRCLESLQLPANMPPLSGQFREAFPNMKFLNPADGDTKLAQRHRWAIVRRVCDEWVEDLAKTRSGAPEPDTGSPLAILARPILSGKADEVLVSWRANSQRLEGELTDEQRQAVVAQLGALAGIDREILASFRADIGRTLPVELSAGRATCQIREVRADSIRVMQTVQREGATGRVGRTLRPGDLAIGEKFRRLGVEESPEKNLQRGVLAMAAGRPDIAGKYFAKADVPLGEALAAEASASQSRRKESRSRREAEQAGTDLLQRLGCPATLRDRARVVAKFRERVDGDLRRIRQARKLLADFEKEWGDNETAAQYVQVVRQALLYPWQGDEPLVVPGIGMELVPLAAGEFKALPPRSEGNVRISRPFWIGKYEVTQPEYAVLTGKNPSRNKGSRKPVESVSWVASVAFCKALTERERQGGRLPDGYEFRLPTDAEWEYAWRAGTASPPVGDPDLIGWHAGNSGGQTHDVGGKKPNAWGLCDMSGNVWEWCLDWYDSAFYARAPSVDPVNLGGDVNHCCHGGCWNEGAGLMTSGHVRSWRDTAALENAGFRVCLGPEIPLPTSETAAPTASQQPVKLPSRGGWLILFDGKGMDAWTPVGTWAVKDGLLMAPGKEQSVLWTKAMHGDYELDLEFRLEARGNSGVYLNDRTTGVADHARYGIEVQLIDDAAYDNLAPEQRCGSIFKRTARRKGAAKPAGEWNRLRVRCRRQRVVVTMNGEKIVDSDVLTKEEVQALQGASAAKGPKLSGDELPPGRIGLQSHTGTVQFRDIRLREL